MLAGATLLLAAGLQAQPAGGSYQARADSALNRRQLAGLTQDVAGLGELVRKLQFEMQALQRENQALRQQLVAVQRLSAAPQGQSGLSTAEMEKILSAMRAKIYQDMDKQRKEFYVSLEDMQKQMNNALNDVASAPPPPPPATSQASSAASSAAASLDYEEYYEHVVVSGDTLYGIHRQYKEYKIRIDDIFAANNLNKNSKLKLGQKIILPIRK